MRNIARRIAGEWRASAVPTLSGFIHPVAASTKGRHLSAVVFATVLACMATPCMAASFDCGKAVTAVERRICDSERLSLADERMDGLFAELMTELAAPARRELRDEQRKWLVFRDQCLNQRNSEDCLAANIDVRRDGLQARLDALPMRPVDVYQPAPCIPRQSPPANGGLREILWWVLSSKAQREERARRDAATDCP